MGLSDRIRYPGVGKVWRASLQTPNSVTPWKGQLILELCKCFSVPYFRLCTEGDINFGYLGFIIRKDQVHLNTTHHCLLSILLRTAGQLSSLHHKCP